MVEDRIAIGGMRLQTRIGVPAEERAQAQEIEVSVSMVPSASIQGISDEIAKTVDYFAVSEEIRRLAGEGERRLIETLAEEIADAVLANFAVAEVTVEIRKFILKDTDHVSVTLSKSAA